MTSRGHERTYVQTEGKTATSRGVDKFLELGGLKTVRAKFLHYHTHFAWPHPHFGIVARALYCTDNVSKKVACSCETC